MAIRLGIGVITYNRKDILRQCIENIQRFTSYPFEFVVADDGSRDGTQAWLDQIHIPYISGENRGIAWNRNRAIWWLKEEKQCDVILLFEDDCYPYVYGWEDEWIKAVEAYGHMNHMPEITLEIDNDVSSGLGTAASPFIAPMHQAFCVGYHARALDYVGYLDVRFFKYGEEHVEHTHRFLRAGYGGLPQYLTPERGQVFFLRGGLATLPSETHGTPEFVLRNIRLHKDIQHEPLYRAPWRTDAQMFLFRGEMETARGRPPLVTGQEDRGFDSFISLGGSEETSFFIRETFGKPGPGFFDGFLTPFHTLIQLFETNFRDLFSTNCLYGYHEALRCRDTLIVYHNCLKLADGEGASVESFLAQRDRLVKEYGDLLQDIDALCKGDRKVLFVRDWRDSLHYEGSHRPLHSLVPDFKRLADAIAKRYPSLDFKILFTNYGEAAVSDPRLIFGNVDSPDVSDPLGRLEGWKDMITKLGIYARNDDEWEV
ncbi:glycosyltransferase family A protein [Acetobacteraceae bacterium ESL0709]|nr:glycosyltransferase family A protein [Acetobacteraceae bacterium ESL0697]MDF7677292.1 glycosyltransferase family A protein [Acetobacteraceae bacterium ESL0709]